MRRVKAISVIGLFVLMCCLSACSSQMPTTAIKQPGPFHFAGYPLHHELNQPLPPQVPPHEIIRH